MRDTLDKLLFDVSAAYGAADHQPQLPLVNPAYSRLQTETYRQLQAIAPFVDIHFVNYDLYASAVELFESIEHARRLYVYNVATLQYDHPLSQLAPNGQTYNSVFRAVHDALAHYPGRHDFTVIGEFRAFRAHARLLSPLAQRAIFTETVGQQAYMRVALGSREYAPQKATLLPASLLARALALEV